MGKMKSLRVRHILVKHKYEAEDILRLLQSGNDFAALAIKYSQCSSAKEGGYLGDLVGKKLDPDFLEAVEILKPGKVSSPVRSRFGYHLIERLSDEV